MKKTILITILVLNFCLNIYGINWGLPSRWCVDEPVASALRMIAEKSIVPPNDFYHPTFHYFVLIAFLVPVLLVLKFLNYPLAAAAQAASSSWIRLSIVDPNFASIVYVAARVSSALSAVAIVYLAYRMARELFSERAGLFAAAFLAVTMSFVSDAHTAKSTAFLIFVVMLTVYLCMFYFKNKSPGRYFYPFLSGGLAIATKYNGLIVLFPLGYYLYVLVKDEIREYGGHKTALAWKALVVPFAALTIGVLIGFPGLIAHFSDYTNATSYYKLRYIPQSHVEAVPLLLSGIVGYLNVLKDAFGIGLFSVVITGILFSFNKICKNYPGKMLLLAAVPYYLFFSLNPKSFEVKYIALIIPILVIMSSGIIDRLSLLPSLSKKVSYFFLAALWAGSFVYTFSACDIYAKKDIRYAATSWIVENVPRDKRMVIIGPSEWVIKNDIFKDRDITLIGENEQSVDPRYNRRFIKGSQQILDNKDVSSLAEAVNAGNEFYIIYPVFIMAGRGDIRKENHIKPVSAINIDGQKIIKVFEHGPKKWFWNPNIGGYEPSEIVITCGLANKGLIK